MKKYIQYGLLSIITCFATSCLRLDDNLFNTDEKISSYTLDAYNDESFKLDDSYKIPDSLVHIFTLLSKGPDESSATKIYAIYVGDINRIATDTVIMYCHGNKFHMDVYWQRVKLLANTGRKNRFGVLIIDYRGYGLSEGKPTEDGLYTDVNTGLQWLKDKGLSNNRLVMYGFSMGTAPATKLTAEPRSMTPSKLLLEAPFASAEVMVEDASVLNVPGKYITGLSIKNAEEIKMVNQPFLWIHGIADDFLNINTHGEVVYKNYHGSYSEAHRIPKANHTDIPKIMGFKEYSDVMLKFITR